MKKIYTLSPQDLHDAIQNTIRVFNEYRLSKKKGPGEAFRVDAGSYFLLYMLFITPEGTELNIKCGKTGGGEIAAHLALSYINQFFSRIDQIANGRIALTPEIVNRDVYKGGQGVAAAFWLIRLVAAIAAIVIAMMVLMH